MGFMLFMVNLKTWPSPYAVRQGPFRGHIDILSRDRCPSMIGGQGLGGFHHNNITPVAVNPHIQAIRRHVVKQGPVDPARKEWFQKVNPWALEEIGRRLMEANARGIWKPDEAAFEQL